MLTKLEFSRQIFEKKCQISNFNKICPVEAELFHADRRRDMTQLSLFALQRTRLKIDAHIKTVTSHQHIRQTCLTSKQIADTLFSSTGESISDHNGTLRFIAITTALLQLPPWQLNPVSTHSLSIVTIHFNNTVLSKTAGAQGWQSYHLHVQIV